VADARTAAIAARRVIVGHGRSEEETKDKEVKGVKKERERR
jgi:hypothetical protein